MPIIIHLKIKVEWWAETEIIKYQYQTSLFPDFMHRLFLKMVNILLEIAGVAVVHF